MDLCTYLTTNVFDTFAENLDIMYLHVYVIVAVVGAGVITCVTGVGLCGDIFMVVLSFKSVESPSGVFAPDKSLPYLFFSLMKQLRVGTKCPSSVHKSDKTLYLADKLC